MRDITTELKEQAAISMTSKFMMSLAASAMLLSLR